MVLSAFLDYLLLEKQYSVHTLAAYKGDLEAFSLFLEGYSGEPLEEVKYGSVRTWMVELSKLGVSNRSINRKMASLRAFYRFLQKSGQRTDNPMAKHQALKVPRKHEVPFSEKEMGEVLELFEYEDDFEGVRDQLMIELLYATGLRRSELVNLKMTDVDLSGKLLKVLGKRNKERFVPLLGTLVSLVDAYIEARNRLVRIEDEAHFFLLESGKKIYPNLVYRTINKYLGKVSPKVKRSPHMLRHTFATHLLAKGADINSVKELLGHASLAATQVYTHTGIAELKKVHSYAHPRNKN